MLRLDCGHLRLRLLRLSSRRPLRTRANQPHGIADPQSALLGQRVGEWWRPVVRGGVWRLLGMRLQ